MTKKIGFGLLIALLSAPGCGTDNNQNDGATDGSAHADMGADGPASGGMSGNGGVGGAGGVAIGSGGNAGSSGGFGGMASGGMAGGGTGGAGTGGALSSGGTSAGGTSSDGAAGGAMGCAMSDGGVDWLATPTVPPALAVPARATVKIHDHGVGAQVYTCTASGGQDAGVDGGATTYAWVLKAPDAKLFDACNEQVGTHGAGPSWTSTVDGSVVKGAKVMQANAPAAAGVPWLLLRATSTSGSGVFGDISYVQRVNTSGGNAPATGCDAGTVGAETRVDYSADYYFYSGGAGAAWLDPPAAPAALAVPAGATVKIHDRGIGDQVYTCTASGGADGGLDGGTMAYAWVLKAPDAILYDATFVQVGTHGAGPSWTSIDGSVVNGTKLQQADSPSAGAVPWLLLKASSTSGAGVFTDVGYVQRLNTTGGKAPATGCDATTVGSETRVSYSADYYFFTSAAIDGGSSG